MFHVRHIYDIVYVLLRFNFQRIRNIGLYVLQPHRSYILRATEIFCSSELPLKQGGSWKYEFLDPCRLLAFRLEHDRDFAAMFAASVALSPPSLERPWRLAIAFDEFTPGDQFRSDNGRKAMVCSFAFIEFGQAALTSEHAWTTPVVVRSAKLQQVVGGWPRVLKDMLHRLLLGSEGLATAGLALRVGDAEVLLFGHVHAILGDGDGHRLLWDWRGQGCFTPCLKHYNVLKKDCFANRRFHQASIARENLSQSMYSSL
jgi:hypothetical protein